MFDANDLAKDFLYVVSSARQFEEKAAGPYTNPALRERIKNQIMAGSEGGRPGQWSARKAQLLAVRYRKAGGGYKKGKKPTKAQRSLKKWTREKWRTSDGKPALRNGRMRRYLPDKVWGRLTPAQRRATNAKKIRGDRAGRQFVPNTDVAARRSRAVRSRSKGINLSDTKKKVDLSEFLKKILGRPVGGISDVDGDGDGFVTGPDGEDNIPAPVGTITPNLPGIAKPDIPQPDDDRDPVRVDDELESPPESADSKSKLKALLKKIGRRRFALRPDSDADQSKTLQERINGDAGHIVKEALQVGLNPNSEDSELISESTVSILSRLSSEAQAKMGSGRSLLNDLLYRVRRGDSDAALADYLVQNVPSYYQLLRDVNGDGIPLISTRHETEDRELTDEEFNMRISEVIADARLIEELKIKGEKERMKNNPVLALWRAHNDEFSASIVRPLPDPSEYDGSKVEEGVLKAQIALQLADDMRALGITEKEAADVLEKLGPIIQQSSTSIAMSYFKATGEQLSPLVLLADELVKQWARTSNDGAVPSIVSQLVARDLMPSLTGLGDEYHRHEDAGNSGLAMTSSVLREARELADDPLVKKVVGAALQAQWARTQEQLSRFADKNGNVRIHRGMGHQDLYEEILTQNRSIPRREAQRLADEVSQQAYEIVDIARDYEPAIEEHNQIVEEMDDLASQMDDIRNDLENLDQEIRDAEDEEQKDEIQQQVDYLLSRFDELSDQWDELESKQQETETRLERMRNEFDRAQSRLEDAIDKLSVRKEDNLSGVVDVKLFPLSATATTVGEAMSFGNDYQVIFSHDVPIESVVSTPVTGFGCFSEDEFVISYPVIEGVTAQLGRSDEYDGVTDPLELTYWDEFGDVTMLELADIGRQDLPNGKPEIPDFAKYRDRGKSDPALNPNEIRYFGSRYLNKALGTPVGGISEFDGDGDGFVTGPDGQDNIPAPVRTAIPNIPDVPKLDDRDPVPADDMDNKPVRRSTKDKLADILKKIGQRKVAWPTRSKNLPLKRAIDQDAAHLTNQILSVPVDPELTREVENLTTRLSDVVADEFKDIWISWANQVATGIRLSASQDELREMVLRRNTAGGALQPIINVTDPFTGARLSEEAIIARADEFIELARQLSEARKAVEEARLEASPVLRLWKAHHSDVDFGERPLPSAELHTQHAEPSVLKAAVIIQIADDMRALGVTDEEAAEVLKKLGSVVENSAAYIAGNHRIFVGGELSPIVLLADELVKQWARTSNDGAVPSIISQLVARDLMPSLTGLGDNYFRHEDASAPTEGMGLTTQAMKEAKKLADDPLVKKVVGAALQAQWARTQEQLGRLADENGNVRIHRGQVNQELWDEVTAQSTTPIDDMGITGNDLKSASSEIADIIERADEEGREIRKLRTALDDVGTKMENILNEIDDRKFDIETAEDEDVREQIRKDIERLRQELQTLSEEWDSVEAELQIAMRKFQYSQQEFSDSQESLQSMINEYTTQKINVKGITDVQLFPLSSTATSLSEATSFGSQSSAQVIIEADIPIESVLSSAATGFGCFAEDELVVSYPIIPDTSVTAVSRHREFNEYGDEVDISTYLDTPNWSDVSQGALMDFLSPESFLAFYSSSKSKPDISRA